MANVILINCFEVTPGSEDRALAFWERAAEYLRKQPGYVSTKLHRAVSPNARFHLINVAEWESPERFFAAVGSDRFKELIAGHDFLKEYPALFEVIRS
jgi:heme-degrading monooxygenase HmoA